MNTPSSIFARLWTSSVAWSWAGNGLRVAAGVLLLPLVLRLLPRPELGMYYLFLSLGAAVMMVDFGFSGALWRAVSLAFAGGRELQAQGLPEPPPAGTPPNRTLLWQVIHTARALYRWLALGALVLLGAGGTFFVNRRVHETADPALTWLAWAVTLAAAVWEIYFSWWSYVLSALNQVLAFARINFLAALCKLALAIVLLLCGAGLLAVPIATLVAGLLQRHLARRACLRELGPVPATLGADTAVILTKLWPNSWRQGLVVTSGYLAGHAGTFLCFEIFGLAATARYGLSMQIMSILSVMAVVWTQVKWPVIGQHCARGDFAAVRRVLRPRVWLQLGTFLLMAAVAVPLAGPLLKWIGSNKEVLPAAWLALLALNALLESHYAIWEVMLSTGNRIPVVWPVVITTAASLTLMVVLIRHTGLELGALVLAPLVMGGVFNYWYWPLAGARSVGTGWRGFMFGRDNQPGPR